MTLSLMSGDKEIRKEQRGFQEVFNDKVEKLP